MITIIISFPDSTKKITMNFTNSAEVYEVIKDNNWDKIADVKIFDQYKTALADQPWKLLRKYRDDLLQLTDKFMVSDFPLDTKTRSRYKDYRQYLRDVTKLFNDETIKDAKVKNFDEWLEFKKSGEY